VIGSSPDSKYQHLDSLQDFGSSCDRDAQARRLSNAWYEPITRLLVSAIDNCFDVCDIEICTLVDASYSILCKPVDQGTQEEWVRGLAGAAFVRYSFRTHNQHPLAEQYYRLAGTERQQLLDHAVSSAKANTSVECVLAIQLMIEFASGYLDVEYFKHREFLRGMSTSETIS